jgi:hypothetical protein
LSGSCGEPVGAETHRRLAVDLYNHAWRLLEQHRRSPAEDDELVHAAHASRWHWGRVGTTANLARGEWLCARVYATLGHPEPALRHAGRCLDLVEVGGEGFEGWDRAAALEAVARARLEAGDLPGARDAFARATDALTAITDPDDRAQIAAELDAHAGLIDRA